MLDFQDHIDFESLIILELHTDFSKVFFYSKFIVKMIIDI